MIMLIVLLSFFDYPFHCRREEGSFHLAEVSKIVEKNHHGEIVSFPPVNMFGGDHTYISACQYERGKLILGKAASSA